MITTKYLLQLSFAGREEKGVVIIIIINQDSARRRSTIQTELEIKSISAPAVTQLIKNDPESNLSPASLSIS